MLLRLIVKNFLSFNELEQFDMFPNTKRVTHSGHIYQREPNPAVLKLSAIYGANGAGKSNLIKALNFIKRFVSNESFLDAQGVRDWRFRLKPNQDAEPIFLAIEFEADDKAVYLYSVTINEKGIQKETLQTSGNHDTKEIVFDRGKDTVTVRGGMTTEMGKIVNNWVIQHSFSSLFTINSSIQLLNDKGVSVSQSWFRNKLKIVTLNSFQPDLIIRLKSQPKLMHFATEMFSKIGLGIEGIAVRTEDFDKWLAVHPKDTGIVSKTEKMPDDVILTKVVDNRNVSAISLEQGVRKISELVFKQSGIEGYSGEMTIQSQSDGTVRLLILTPYLYGAMTEGETIVVDELDNSIHPHLVRELVKYFANRETNGQLVFSTHETCILDQSFLRPDEVWFVEKSNGVSHPYSLNDFKIHNTLSIENGYLMGRYGAIPFIGSLNF